MVITHHTAPNKRKGGRTARQAQGQPKPVRVSHAGSTRKQGSWRGNKGTAHERGYTARWQRSAKRFLDSNPLCAMCLDAGNTVPATVVDHIRPHRGDDALFWDCTNWQPLCKTHHDGDKQHIDNKGYSKAIATDGWPIDPLHPVNRGI